MNDLELKIATIEVQLRSIINTLEQLAVAINPKNKGIIEDYDKWKSECEKVAKDLLESQKEKEKENE